MTWGENIGSISMLHPQNMINAPAGNNATITNIFNGTYQTMGLRHAVINSYLEVNRSDGDDTKPKNAQHGDLYDDFPSNSDPN